MKSYRIFFSARDILNVHMLCVAPLYSPLKWQWYLAIRILTYFQIFLDKYDRFLHFHMIVRNEFWESYLDPSIFSIKHSRSAWTINGVLSDFWHWLNSNILVLSEAITMSEKSLFPHTFYEIHVSFLLQKTESNWDNKNHRDI